MNIEQIRQIAKNETTAPEKLEKLAHSEDYQTRKSVAENPNTPTETLLSICFEFPKEVINNPVIPLLILENPYSLTCKIKINFDFNKIKQLTDIEIKRLGWTKEQGRNYLKQTYGKRSRLHLTDKELYEFLCYLKSLNKNNSLKNITNTSKNP